MIKRLLLLLPVFWLCYGCSDDDCPTCVDETNVLFYCSASFRAIDPDWGVLESSLGITAGFIGDPVPTVDAFGWINGDLERTDVGFPTFNDDFQTDYVKYVPVTAVLDGDTITFEITIPDSTRIITPGEVASSGGPVIFEWVRSQDAEFYIFSVLVSYRDVQELVFVLDTTVTTSDTSFTLPSEYSVAGYTLHSQLLAGIGTNGEPGDDATFRSGRYSGFLGGAYKAGFLVTELTQ